MNIYHVLGASMFSTAVGFGAGWLWGWVCGSRDQADKQAWVRRMLDAQKIGPDRWGTLSSPLSPPAVRSTSDWKVGR